MCDSVKIIRKEFIEKIYNDFEKFVATDDYFTIKTSIQSLYNIENLNIPKGYVYSDRIKNLYKQNKNKKNIYYNPLDDILTYIFNLYKGYKYLKIDNNISLKNEIIDICYKDLNKDIMFYQLEYKNNKFLIIELKKK